MQDNMNNKDAGLGREQTLAQGEKAQAENEKPQYSLNDDRRVRVLSPGLMVAKRFIRNRMAVTGLVVLVIMFLFSFLGGVISPYTEKQLFYRDEVQRADYAGVVLNKELRFTPLDADQFTGIVQAQTLLAIQKASETFSYRGVSYALKQEGTDFYSVSTAGRTIGIAHKDVVTISDTSVQGSFDFIYGALKAYLGEEKTFTADGADYTVDETGGVLRDGAEVGYIGRYVVQAIMPDIVLTKNFKEQLIASIEAGSTVFNYTDEAGATYEYDVEYDASHDNWTVLQAKQTRVYDTYSPPSSTHWLGTDRNGMDMMTRLMYGGRVSLMIGFIVVFIETFLGIIFGGISGYFGGWVDNLIMRVVDIFYCIPSLPIIIILGAAMDAMRVDPQTRMIYLMLILGFLGWPGIARMVRGQILSLREQEFMTATEACGISVRRRIFKHLIPNVIPQLIVTATMGLGSTIITEATLSFLGLGVKFPFASWGNIINDVNNTFVLTNYWFIWIPAGICLLVTVLAFNLVGDGLRDAFDPKMKR